MQSLHRCLLCSRATRVAFSRRLPPSYRRSFHPNLPLLQQLQASSSPSPSSLSSTNPSSPAFHSPSPSPSSSTTSHLEEEDEGPPVTIMDLLSEDVFTQYNLAKTEENIPLLKAYDILREAEHIIRNESGYETVEPMLIGLLDWLVRNEITDPWLQGVAHLNLAYCMQLNLKPELALANYQLGFQHLKHKDIKDDAFIGLRKLSFAELLASIGRNDSAAQISFSAITHLEKVHTKLDTTLPFALSNLASYLVLDGKHEKALPYAKRAFHLLAQGIGMHNDFTRHCATNLASLYKKTGKQEQLAELDEMYKEDDQPLLDRYEGRFSQSYLNDLKRRWMAMGPRAIFDPPGIHRSQALSATAYKAFFQEWERKFPLLPEFVKVVSAETKSLTYAHDVIEPYTPKEFRGPLGEVPTDVPRKLKEPFRKLKLPPPVTSLGKELDKKASLPPVTERERTITPDEWREVARRQAAYRKKHGDPIREAEEDEFIRANRDMEKRAREEEEDEEEEEEDEDKQEKREVEALEQMEEGEEDDELLDVTDEELRKLRLSDAQIALFRKMQKEEVVSKEKARMKAERRAARRAEEEGEEEVEEKKSKWVRDNENEEGDEGDDKVEVKHPDQEHFEKILATQRFSPDDVHPDLYIPLTPYDAIKAAHGTKREQAFESSKTYNDPAGNESLARPPPPHNKHVIPDDYQTPRKTRPVKVGRNFWEGAQPKGDLGSGPSPPGAKRYEHDTKGVDSYAFDAAVDATFQRHLTEEGAKGLPDDKKVDHVGAELPETEEDKHERDKGFDYSTQRPRRFARPTRDVIKGKYGRLRDHQRHVDDPVRKPH